MNQKSFDRGDELRQKLAKLLLTKLKKMLLQEAGAVMTSSERDKWMNLAWENLPYNAEMRLANSSTSPLVFCWTYYIEEAIVHLELYHDHMKEVVISTYDNNFDVILNTWIDELDKWTWASFGKIVPQPSYQLMVFASKHMRKPNYLKRLKLAPAVAA
jgi:hypothetical protein